MNLGVGCHLTLNESLKALSIDCLFVYDEGAFRTEIGRTHGQSEKNEQHRKPKQNEM
jgi:hypothetical protein